MPLATAMLKGNRAGAALCVSGSVRGSVTASVGVKGTDCVSSAARSCGVGKLAGAVKPSARPTAGCSMTGCGA